MIVASLILLIYCVHIKYNYTRHNSWKCVDTCIIQVQVNAQVDKLLNCVFYHLLADKQMLCDVPNVTLT